MTATERCETTELLADQCGCPKHRGGRTHQEEAAADLARFYDRPGPWFAATRPGECSCCEVPFRAGKQIRADGEGGWACCS